MTWCRTPSRPVCLPCSTSRNGVHSATRDNRKALLPSSALVRPPRRPIPDGVEDDGGSGRPTLGWNQGNPRAVCLRTYRKSCPHSSGDCRRLDRPKKKTLPGVPAGSALDAGQAGRVPIGARSREVPSVVGRGLDAVMHAAGTRIDPAGKVRAIWCGVHRPISTHAGGAVEMTQETDALLCAPLSTRGAMSSRREVE